MLHYLVEGQALFVVLLQDAVEQILEIVAEVLLHHYVAAEEVGLDVFEGLSVLAERWFTNHNLIEEASEGPNVETEVVSTTGFLLIKHFWGDVLGSANHCGPGLELRYSIANPKVADLDVARHIEQDILRLQITVNDFVFVQVLQHKDGLGTVEPGFLLRHVSLFLQEGEQIAAIDQVQHEIEPVGGLESVVQVEDEVVIKLQENIPFSHRGLSQVVLDQQLFLVDFECILLAPHGSVLGPVRVDDQVDLRIGASADELLYPPVLEIELPLLAGSLLEAVVVVLGQQEVVEVDTAIPLLDGLVNDVRFGSRLPRA